MQICAAKHVCTLCATNLHHCCYFNTLHAVLSSQNSSFYLMKLMLSSNSLENVTICLNKELKGLVNNCFMREQIYK